MHVDSPGPQITWPQYASSECLAEYDGRGACPKPFALDNVEQVEQWVGRQGLLVCARRDVRCKQRVGQPLEPGAAARAHQVRDAAAQQPPEKRPLWTADEDAQLRDRVSVYCGLIRGDRWRAVAEAFPGKTPRQCRLRWTETLRWNPRLARSASGVATGATRALTAHPSPGELRWSISRRSSEARSSVCSAV